MSSENAAQSAPNNEVVRLNCPDCTGVLNLRRKHLGVAGACVHCKTPIMAVEEAGVIFLKRAPESKPEAPQASPAPAATRPSPPPEPAPSPAPTPASVIDGDSSWGFPQQRDGAPAPAQNVAPAAPAASGFQQPAPTERAETPKPAEATPSLSPSPAQRVPTEKSATPNDALFSSDPEPSLTAGLGGEEKGSEISGSVFGPPQEAVASPSSFAQASKPTEQTGSGFSIPDPLATPSDSHSSAFPEMESPFGGAAPAESPVKSEQAAAAPVEQKPATSKAPESEGLFESGAESEHQSLFTGGGSEDSWKAKEPDEGQARISPFSTGSAAPDPGLAETLFSESAQASADASADQASPFGVPDAENQGPLFAGAEQESATTFKAASPFESPNDDMEDKSSMFGSMPESSDTVVDFPQGAQEPPVATKPAAKKSRRSIPTPDWGEGVNRFKGVIKFACTVAMVLGIGYAVYVFTPPDKRELATIKTLEWLEPGMVLTDYLPEGMRDSLVKKYEETTGKTLTRIDAEEETPKVVDSEGSTPSPSELEDSVSQQESGSQDTAPQEAEPEANPEKIAEAEVEKAEGE